MTLALQTCVDCGTVQYPTRAVCRACLSDRLESRDQPAGGILLAKALLATSLDPDWSARLPVAAAMVLLDAGTQAIVLTEGDPAPGTRVAVRREGPLLVAKEQR